MNFIITVPIYPGEIMVSIGQTIAQRIESARSWPKTDADVRYEFVKFIENDQITEYWDGGIYTIPDRGYVFLAIDNQIKTPYHHANLAHEIFHATEHILAHAGVKHSEESSEAFAYLISFITESIYKKLRR